MSNQTIPDPQRSTDPGRFSTARQQVDQGASGGQRVLAALGLLALLVGIPALLWFLAGTDPFPTELPSKETLTSQLDFTTLLNVLVFVVWVAWLMFVVCVVTEVVAARRGGLAQPVPLGGPLQKLARTLVGALLLGGVVMGPAASATTAPADNTGSRTAATSVTQDQGEQARADQQAEQAAEEERQQVQERRAAHEITEQEHLVGHKVYTVAAPKDGYHDNLWDIAERHLNDGRRYKEIYELNKGLRQPDGRKLELARLIQPGWNLVMPEDAVGVKRLTAPSPAKEMPTLPSGEDPDSSAAAADADVVDAGRLPGGVGAALGGAGLLAAAALGALAFERRRRIGAAAAAAAAVEVELRCAATPSRAAFLDRALRDLLVRCRETSSPLPSIYAVLVDDETITMRLAPASGTTVGDWHTDDQGATWVRGQLEPDEALESEQVPYPVLVSLGVDDQGRDVLVDLEAARGVVAVDGDPGLVSEVAAAIALQAGTASWATSVRVTASGLPDGLAGIGDDRIHVVDDLTPSLGTLEQQLSESPADVLTGRLARRSTALSRLVVAGRADDELAERLVGLTGAERQSLSVVLAGSHPAARWTLRVDDTGHLRLDELGIAVTANRIGAQQVEGIAALFEAAREPDRPDDGGMVAIPEPLREADDATWTTASRRVGVLGPIAVTGVERADEARADQLTELVTYLALHPEGVHPNVLAGVLWPRGVTPDVSDMAVERARTWLGDDVNGHSYLREDADGRLSLSEGVVCDWDAVRSLFLRARSATSRRDEIEHLRRGLQLIRGESFTGTPEGRYAWVAHDDLERSIRRIVVASSHRLVELLDGDDDPSGAAAAAEAGLRVDPANQLLWRDLLRVRYTGDGVAGVRRTLDAMGAPLRGIPLEPETEALIQEYLPETASTG
ncbi:MAG TPA: hypothetical protein VFJ28_01920 [Marmoricola sp.]|nr:hypothetical protein [Marmoricola sp.]